MNAPAPSPRPPLHFIVRRTNWEGGAVYAEQAEDPQQFAHRQTNDPNHYVGACCVRTVSLGSAEDLAHDPNLWEPINPFEIAAQQELHRQAKLAAKAHYPAAW